MQQYLLMEVDVTDYELDEYPSYAIIPVDRLIVDLMIEQYNSLTNVPGLLMGEFITHVATYVTSHDVLDYLMAGTKERWMVTETDLSLTKLIKDWDILVSVDVPVMRCYMGNSEKPVVTFSAIVRRSVAEVFTDGVDLNEVLKSIGAEEGVS